MMAYLLISLYTSASFDPSTGKLVSAESSSNLCSQTYEAPYRFMHATLPSYMALFVPAPTASFAPIPSPEVMTPEIMKKAIVALSTRDVLKEIPANTVNLLIFDNATTR